jgi:peptidoglycan hydrolase CwlO-like protein
MNCLNLGIFRDSNYKVYFKDSLLNSLFKRAVNSLQEEYEKLDNSIAVYRDVVKANKKIPKTNSNVYIYEGKIEEAKRRKTEISNKIDEIKKMR